MFKPDLLKGKRILITGGGTGLGKAMAAKLLSLGAEIAICGRRKQVCDDTAAALMSAHGGKVSAYGVDIRDAAAVDAMVEVPVQILGKVRGKIQVPTDASEAQMVAIAQADPRIADLLAGKQIVKTVVVPGRLVNFVIRG